MKEYNSVCAEIMAQARLKHDVSLSQMATYLNVSRQTISAWETSKAEPTLSQAFYWFEVLGESPMLFLMAYMHPTQIKQNGLPHNNDTRLLLHERIDAMSDLDVEKLSFILHGLSGSHPKGLLDLITAYSHLPLMFKVLSSKALLADYLTAESMGMLQNTDKAMPDVEFLRQIIIQASEALSSGKENYL